MSSGGIKEDFEQLYQDIKENKSFIKYRFFSGSKVVLPTDFLSEKQNALYFLSDTEYGSIVTPTMVDNIKDLISSLPNLKKLKISSNEYGVITKQMVDCLAGCLTNKKIKLLQMIICDGDIQKYQPIYDALETNHSLNKLRLFGN
ncbi:hypothetical protein DFA_05594 [Cavenderia fasciculata]|uniref:Uncharacterized protein n=1 Tax=Cavenderia fasciculata TaxID=261658 RepID=F4PLN9_CACFS|nr:uncharacterized protein DFA_05594 [Cavenderia fasciculata]EGG23461.1 hypothetical protein DFA_05594 [Cavenderia fasciculata]|eukprot:XP_004361312.1 hypothetical protein DFA_05594 [Cavenderia fasciculata]